MAKIFILSAALALCASAAAFTSTDCNVHEKKIVKEYSVVSDHAFILSAANDFDYTLTFIAPAPLVIKEMKTHYVEVKDAKAVKLFDLVTHPRHNKRLHFIKL